jgi:hypothetical protein
MATITVLAGRASVLGIMIAAMTEPRPSFSRQRPVESADRNEVAESHNEKCT